MKVTVLNGSPRVNGNTSAMVESFKKGAERAGHEVEVMTVGKPPKATKYGMILSSGSAGVYDAIISQYNDVFSYFGAINVGVVTAYGNQNKTQEKLDEVYNLGKNL